MTDVPINHRRGLRERLALLPWWVRLIIGLVIAALGLWLVVRPLSSTNLLVVVIGLAFLLNGIGQLLQPGATRLSIISAIVLIFAGIAIFVFRGFTTSILAVIVALAPIVIGITRIVDAIRADSEERASGFILAAAAILAGISALAWPDLTLLVAAVAFGGWTLLLGLQFAWSAIVSRLHGSAGGSSTSPPVRRGWFLRSARLFGAVALFLVVAAVGIVSVRLHQGLPQVDGFYAAPAVVPSEPGVLLRAEPFTRAMPEGSRAWRILYTTTRDEGQPALASALVVAPRDPPAGPLPLIAWTHGTTGFAQICAPSLLPDPLVAGAMFTADQVVAHGWVLVATDYVGLGTQGPHPYLIGQAEGRSALDSIRAVRQLKGLTLADKTVVWGHSQGGHAALWTGGLASTYAPELDIAGVASLAPASDLEGLVANLTSVRGGLLFAAYALAGYDAVYDDIRDRDYVDPSSQTLLRELSERCLADPRVYVSIVEALAIFGDRDVFSPPLTTGPMLARLRENTPTLPIRAPLLLAQGLADPLVVPGVQRAYVQRLCDSGQALEYLAILDKDHVGLVEAASPLIPPLIKWTEDRLAGVPAANGCASVPVE